MILAPQIGFSCQNYAETYGAITTNYPGTGRDIGLGFYYVLLPFEGLSVQAGPAIEFASDGYKKEGNTDEFQFTFVAVDLNLRMMAMITKSLGVQYYWQDSNDTTIQFDSALTVIGLQTVALGVVCYLK